MTPPISSPPSSSNFSSSNFNNSNQGHDENKFISNSGWSANFSSPRVSTQKGSNNPSSKWSKGRQQGGPLAVANQQTQQKHQNHGTGSEGWAGVSTHPLPFGSSPKVLESAGISSTSSSKFSMLEPVSVSMHDRHGLTAGNEGSHHRRHGENPRTNVRQEFLDGNHELAMTSTGRRTRNPADILQDSNFGGTGSSTPTRQTATMMREGEMLRNETMKGSNRGFASSHNLPRTPRESVPGSPIVRSRQQQQQQHQHVISPTVHLPQQQSTSQRDSHSVQSQTSGSAHVRTDWQWEQNNDPDDQEQALFEQRLCEDVYGVAVRKINQNGKSNLRYVKCCHADASELEVDANGFSSSRSVSSRSRGFSRFTGRDRSLDRSESREHDAHRTSLMKGKKVKVLTWGKKKDVKIPLERFVCVRKGKSTDRARRNPCPPSRILSLITDDPHNPSLDIEAPTRLDRDKFARAFSRFLGIPMEGDDIRSVRSDMTPQSAIDRKRVAQPSLGQHLSDSAPEIHSSTHATSSLTSNSRRRIPLPVVTTASEGTTKQAPTIAQKNAQGPAKFRSSADLPMIDASERTHDIPDPQIGSLPSSHVDSGTDHRLQKNNPASVRGQSTTAERTSDVSAPRADVEEDEENSVVSSITGGGFDQEIVEELHLALNELKAELEESRAEAARAVKVAEQAIQSAENSSSKDWNSTVTHKAAEAAAIAQKKSAEALTRARLAEERLEGERKNASIWKKQAEAAEEEAGHWQTRAAAAEVQRAAMVEALGSERQKAAALMDSVKERYASSEVHQRDALESTLDRNRALELEVEVLRQSLNNKSEEVSSLQDALAEVEAMPETLKNLRKKSNFIGRSRGDEKDGAARALLSVNSLSSQYESRDSTRRDAVSPTELVKVQSQVQMIRKQFEMLKKHTSDDLAALPDSAKIWAEQASQAVLASQTEIDRLRSKLAVESAARRKLLHEVQDLRGNVRVYCRPMKAAKEVSVISSPSREVVLLHRERGTSRQEGSKSLPLSFEFDGILEDDMGQQDLYDELEDVFLSAMDGYNVCVMTYGQSRTGKTHTMLGDVVYGEGKSDTEASITNFGVHLRAAQQIFSVLRHRSERYKEIVTFNIVEVQNERLCDLLAGTEIGESSGRMEASRRSNRKRLDSQDGTASQNSRPGKLEIRTNHNGETVVHGLLSVEVSSFEDVCRVWKECLTKRAARLAEQGINLTEYESSSHVIGTLRIYSTNISTGIGTCGKIQFVDLASSDVVPKRSTTSSKRTSAPEPVLMGVGNNHEWKFLNKSIATLNEVVTARSQFQRSVPYRNSTITHLLGDSLEADTKVVLIACVSSDLKDIQQTASTLKFSQKLRKVVVGKATKHTITLQK